MSIIITFVLLAVLLIFGMPVAFAIGISGSIGLLMVEGWDSLLGILLTAPYTSVNSFLLSAIPMFILMASFMTVSGIMKDLINAAYKWLGKLPGGLGIATVFAGAVLGAVSGSSQASAATMASSVSPEMKKYNYKDSFNLGVISISGTLAVMIPPSIVLIMYGILTETSVGALLISGIIPGLLTALGYVLVILLSVKINPELAPIASVNVTFKERMSSLKTVWPMLIIIISVLGGIYSGIITATEAGAIGALITFIIILIMGKLSLKKFNAALNDAIKNSTMILTIIMGAHIFGYFLTMTQITQNLIIFVQGSSISSFTILLIILVIYLILGLFMDQLAILVLTLPLTFPIIESLGFNPIWFGIVVTKTVEMGLVTPPLGMNVFVASGSSGIKTSEGFKGVISFLIMDFIILAILVAFPILSTWLPSKI